MLGGNNEDGSYLRMVGLWTFYGFLYIGLWVVTVIQLGFC